MTLEPQRNGVERLGLLASAIAGRPMKVRPGAPGEPTWTDGKVVFVDAAESARTQLDSLVVQASLVAAGSLTVDLVRGLGRRDALAKRYLALEGRRALTSVATLLPPRVSSLLDAHRTPISTSPEASLALARSREPIDDPPPCFGAIRTRRLLATMRAESSPSTVSPRPVPVVSLAPDATTVDEQRDSLESPVGGAGAIGKWLSKLLTAARRLQGGGSPGAADAPTHSMRRARTNGKAPFSSVAPERLEDAASSCEPQDATYPEWDVHELRYREDHCSVQEVEAERGQEASRFTQLDRLGVRRALARLALGIDRQMRQAHGDDVDIDAAIEARVRMMTASTPDDAVFVDHRRCRRDLSVLLLLDISGSAAELGDGGRTVHDAQRAAAAALMLALHELGDRVALYAYHSRGRSAVTLTRVKRFDQAPSADVLQRLVNLQPGAYSRLGAAIRHGTAVLREHGGTPRRLLVVLSDGLAYDHGYEPAYGAADARRALAEARCEGVGSVCLTVESTTDVETLRRVFGATAYAALAEPRQVMQVVEPLFRAAIRSADVKRRID